ncbi:MAG: hypothetical protein ACR2K5_04075 [Pseudolabrys sp.]
MAGVFRTLLALGPGCADAADEIEAGVGLRRQFGGLFAFPDAEVLVAHALAVVMPGIAVPKDGVAFFAYDPGINVRR